MSNSHPNLPNIDCRCVPLHERFQTNLHGLGMMGLSERIKEKKDRGWLCTGGATAGQAVPASISKTGAFHRKWGYRSRHRSRAQ
jgi:hypothetical protein